MKVICVIIALMVMLSGSLNAQFSCRLPSPPSFISTVYRQEADVLIDTMGNTYKLVQDLAQVNRNTEAVIVKNRGLTKFPLELLKAKRLKVLILSDNDIDSLPNEIGQLKQLVAMDLSNNNILSLPESVAALSKIQYIDLSGNPIESVTNSMLQWKALTAINLHNTAMPSLPEDIDRWTKLTYLDWGQHEDPVIALDGPRERSIPHYFEVHDRKLPNRISQITQLHTLLLVGNFFEAIPTLITQIQSLRYLDYSDNGLETLPSELANNHNLETLILCSNNISELRPSLAQLNQLKHLNITNNQFEWLPEFIGGFNQLEALYASSNKINELPNSFSSLKNLKVLSLSINPLATDFWSNIRLEQLQKLDLSNTPLSQLPEWFFQMKNLEEINLANCPLVKFPNGIDQLLKLRILNLGNIPLDAVPNGLEQLTNLRVCEIRGILLDDDERDALKKAMPQCKFSMGISKAEILNYTQENLNELLRDKRYIEEKIPANDPERNRVMVANYKSIAWAMMVLGSYEEAEKYLRDAIVIDPMNSKVISNLALVNLFQGRLEEARLIYSEWMNKPFDSGDTFKTIFLSDIQNMYKNYAVPKERKNDFETIKQLLK